MTICILCNMAVDRYNSLMEVSGQGGGGMAELFESLMVISFGVSWPMNIIRAYKGRTAKGTSIIFLSCIELGYISSIIWKLLTGDMQAFFAGDITKYGCFFYLLNAVMVFIAIVIFFKNKALDIKEKEANNV